MIQPSLRLALGLAVLLVSASARAELPRSKKTETAKPPSAAAVRELAVHPKAVTLTGADDSTQLILTGVLAVGNCDLTGDAQYTVADPKIARVTSAGRIVPLANGATTVTARYGPRSATVALDVTAMDTDLPINFANQIVPIFTKLGCNAGGCHGKSGGQNGFALSLLGFVPELDYQTLVKENRGRRVFPAAPDRSLLLAKAAGVMAHGGGKRMDADSDEYRLVRRWIASGLPIGSSDDPVVAKITVFPEERVVARKGRQQLAVLAHYSDGHTQDVTGRAQYESNDPDIAIVDGAGLVRALDLSGDAAVMVRYQSQVAVFRATVPLGRPIPEYAFEPQTVVDRATHAKWQKLGIVPSDLASDEIFLRRVFIDITGTLPTPTQVRAFLDDTAPNKRDRLVDALVETPEYSYYFANLWADVLRVKRGNNQNKERAYGTFAFHGWIRDRIAADTPYDEFARDIVAALGNETTNPPALWYRELQKPEQFVDDACQVFLGVRIACAQCHHHPYEKWSQDDYWGMAAFFGQVGRKKQATPGQNNQQGSVTIYNKGTGTVTNTRTKKPAAMRPLDGPAAKVAPGDDPRQHLVDWMVDRDNPFFARAVANRYWAHFFGKGIVDPVDDMRVTNPPSNPALLDALAKELVESDYSLKHLVKVICKSRTYQLGSMPNEYNRSDKKAFARSYPRRMTAEVLYDAVSQVTDSPAKFNGLPNDKHAPNRAIMLPDESFSSYFLDVFGRPQRISACACERVTEPNLAQSLHLLNSQEIQGKLSKAGGRAERLAKDPRPDAEKVEELFLWALGRRPSTAQLNLALDHLSAAGRDKRAVYENILWALINTKEFVLVQ